MWGDLEIGYKKKRPSNYRISARHVFKIKGNHSISQNDVEYWIDDLIFDTGIRIFKDSPQGIELTELINKEITLTRITNYLNKIVIKNLSIIKTLQGIKNIQKKSFEEGVKYNQEQVKKHLGIK